MSFLRKAPALLLSLLQACGSGCSNGDAGPDASQPLDGDIEPDGGLEPTAVERDGTHRLSYSCGPERKVRMPAPVEGLVWYPGFDGVLSTSFSCLAAPQEPVLNLTSSLAVSAQTGLLEACARGFVADVDGNRLPDLISFKPFGPGAVRRANSSGALGELEEIAGASDFLQLLPADVDGDNRSEIVAFTAGEDGLRVYTRNATVWTMRDLDLGSPISAVTAGSGWLAVAGETLRIGQWDVGSQAFVPTHEESCGALGAALGFIGSGAGGGYILSICSHRAMLFSVGATIERLNEVVLPSYLSPNANFTRVDLNNDGVDELVNIAAERLIVFRVADGRIEPPRIFRLGQSSFIGSSPLSARVAFFDANGDKREDIAIAEAAISEGVWDLRVALGTEDGFALPEELSIGRQPTVVVAGDVSASAGPEIVVISQLDRRLSILSATSTNANRTISSFDLASVPTDIALSDWDGDGMLELFVSYLDDARVDIFSAQRGEIALQGSVSLREPAWHIAHGPVGPTRKHALAVVRDRGERALDVHWAEGLGFGAPTNLIGKEVLADIEIEDLDRDGAPDIVASGRTRIHYFRATATDFEAFEAVAERAFGLDVSGNDRIVATANLDRTGVGLYLQEPTRLLYRKRLPLDALAFLGEGRPLAPVRAVRFADLNGDGTQEIIVGMDADFVVVLERESDFIFPRGYQIVAPKGAIAADVTDLNGDDFPEIITVGYDEGLVGIIPNECGGR